MIIINNIYQAKKTASPWTFSSRISSADEVIAILVGDSSTNLPTSVTFNGNNVPLASGIVEGTEMASSIYIVWNPPVGTYTVNIVDGNTGGISGTVVSLLGVSKRSTTPIQATTGATAVVAGTQSLNLQVASANSMILDVFSINDASSAITADPSQTQLMNILDSAGNSVGASYKFVSPGVQTMRWTTITTVGATAWAAVIFEPDDAPSIWYPNIQERSEFDAVGSLNSQATLTPTNALLSGFSYKPSTFFQNSFLHTVGRQLQNIVAPNFSFVKTITIDHTRTGSSADSSHFPVLISGTYAYLAGTGSGGQVTSVSGFDIGFYNDAALTQKLNWQTELYTTGSGLVAYWVQVPNLSITVDTVIYMAYGNAAITTDQSNPAGVWDTNFQLVQHLTNGSVLSLADTTGHFSSVNNGATATTGQFDGGVAETGSGYYAVTNGFNSISGNNNHTIEMWVKSSSFGTQPILIAYAGSVGDTGIEFNSTGTQLFWFYRTSPAVNTRTVNVDISDGQWHSLAAVKTGAGDSGIFYLDGQPATTASGTLNSTPTQANQDLGIGRYTAGSPLTWQGSIDEVRISNVSRSADWVLATFNSQSKPDKATFGATGFYTISGGALSLAAETELETSQIVIDRITQQASASASSLTSDHLVTSQDAVMLVYASQMGVSQAINAVSLNGVALTALGGPSISTLTAGAYFIVNPNVGVNTVSMSVTLPTALELVVLTLLGVDKRTVNPVFVSGSGLTGSPSSIIQVASANSLLIDYVGSLGTSITENTSQTVYFDQPQTASQAAGSIKLSTVGNQTMSWTTLSSAWVQLVVALEPANALSMWYPSIDARNLSDVIAVNGLDDSSNATGSFYATYGNHPTQYWQNSFLHTIGRLPVVAITPPIQSVSELMLMGMGT